MKHLIDKDTVVAEIESKKKRAQILGDNAINSSMQQFYDGMKQGCVDILSFLDTLEAEEEPEFTVDDIMKLDALLIRMWQSKSPNKYEEVLKQFKAQKGE